MKKLKAIFAVLLVTWAMAAAAQATVIDFNEVPVLTSNPTISGVGFWGGDPANWFDAYTDDSWTPGNSYLTSGRYDSSVTTPMLVDTFIGVNLASGTTKVSFDILSEEVLPGGTTLWAQAFSGGTLVGSTSLFVNDSSYYNMALSSASGIDSLYIFDDLNSYSLSEAFHIDNFTADTGAPPVPEPSTLVLMASGLAAAVAWRKRRNQRT